MNIILEKRKDINDNNNTAKAELLDIINGLDTSIKELVIDQPLHGVLDLSVLANSGFMSIHTIILRKKGELTYITKIPKSVKKLHCDNQYLIDLAYLPNGIEELSCNYNYIQHLDLYGLNKLKVLRLSNNKLTELENLPESLEELYLENNNLKRLNLKGLMNLRVLHTSGNRTIIIENLPPSVVDFQSENNPFISTDYMNLYESGEQDETEKEKEMEMQIDYMQSLYDYYKLKSKYEIANSSARIDRSRGKKYVRRVMSKYVPKCINCNKPGGTGFFKKNGTHYALCGNKTEPCNLRIEIFTGKNEMVSTTLKEEFDLLDQAKRTIIENKMDNIFNYPGGKNVDKFKDAIDDFTFWNNDHKILLDKYNKLYKDPAREELIAQKTKHIYDLISAIKELMEQYAKDGNGDLLKTAVQIQTRDLNPEINNLRKLKYEIMEMDYQLKTNAEKDEKEAEDVIIGEYNEILVQKYHSLANMEEHLGKPPKVVKWRK